MAENFHYHSDAQKLAIQSVLSEIGWVSGVIVNKNTGNLLDGKMRVEEALARDPESLVPYLEVDLSETEEKKILAVFDPIGAMAKTDAELYQELAQLIAFESAALADLSADISGSSCADQLEVFTDEAVAPDRLAFVAGKWDVARSDLWRIGEHLLLCGDATNHEDAARLMNGEQAELLFTSPPYADQRTYTGDGDLSPAHLSKFIGAFAPFARFQIVNLGIKRRDHEIDEYWQTYIEAARASGYLFLSWNIWDRGQATSVGLQTAMFAIDHEWIFVFGKAEKKLIRTVRTKDSSREREKHKKRRTRRNSKDEMIVVEKWENIRSHKQLGTVLRLPQANTIGNSDHPAQFPVELPARHIEAMSAKGDIVVEPFSGSGTTLVACQNLERRCRAMEISPQYVALTLERMHKTFGIEPILESKK